MPKTYDRGLLLISDDGLVELSGDVMAYYGEFNGAVVTFSGRVNT